MTEGQAIVFFYLNIWHLQKSLTEIIPISPEAAAEAKRKEESSGGEELEEEMGAKREAYTKAQSMKSLFQQGQTITTKRCKIHGIDEAKWEMALLKQK